MASVTFDATHPRNIKIRWTDFEHGFVINGQKLGRHGKAIATDYFHFSASWNSLGAEKTEQFQRLLTGSSNDRAALRYEITKDPEHPGCSLIVGEFSMAHAGTPLTSDMLHYLAQTAISPELRYGRVSEDFNAPFLLGHWIVEFPKEVKLRAGLAGNRGLLPAAY
ncbi:hypothetical protein H8K32_03330 [Undibacterium jejuense]|uniref:Uncharacterized protein n=1 Tax=Undibacterium jejuense TaxID=1344949 RepID=A0A923KJV5_9BURK|nr:hypothetical protein [Undibacterium jejuense]MBC3861120.1 hypothetical protein [Undibacterium jejuense]